MPPNQAWTRTAQVAAAQQGLVTRRQCLDAGVPASSLDRALRPGGRWQAVLPGVYATFTGPLLPVHLMSAALLLGGPGAQLTGVTALALYGCTYLPSDPRVHLLVPMRTRRATGALPVRVHRTGLLPEPYQRDGLPVSPPDRAAILAARHLSNVREIRALLSEVVQRRLSTLDRLETALAAGPSSGSARPRRVLDELAAGCRSAPEIELRELLGRRPRLLAGAVFNHPVTVGTRRYRADACWPSARVIVEVDSVSHHGFGEAAEWTARRRAELVAAGWRVLSVSPWRIRSEPDQVLAQVEALVCP
jgi:very-short-patch-repair endonuclease